MLGTICAIAAFVFLIVFILALFGVVTFSWLTALVLALIFGVASYFLGGNRL